MDNPLYLYDLEYKNVIGVDEAGRGPLAGPVVAAAVILKEYSEELDEINDSKKLTEKKREKLYDIIMKNFYVTVGVSTVEEIDKLNILNADFLAMRRALKDLENIKKDKKEYMTNSEKIKVINFDNLSKKGYSKMLRLKGQSFPFKTNDALYLDVENNKFIFIEFKNGSFSVNEKNFKDLNEKRNIFEENISSEQKYLVIDEQTSLQIQDKIPVEEEVYDLADLFKIFSDSTRIKILCILFESEMCVYDLSGILGMSQSAVSHQLRLLKQSKLVKHRREGKIIFYSLSDDHIRKIIDNGLEHIQE